MENQESIRTTIKAYLLEEFLPGESPDALSDSTALVSSGVLDSIATLKLAAFIEEQFGIQLQAHEIGEENFDNLESITRFVQFKTREE